MFSCSCLKVMYQHVLATLWLILCIEVDCGEPPSGTNSIVSYTSTTQGQSATYSCPTGYEDDGAGDDTIFCIDTGNWLGDALNCEFVDCGIPETLTGNSTVYNSKKYTELKAIQPSTK